MLDHALPRSFPLAIAAALLAVNAGLGVMLPGARTEGVALALVPLGALVLGTLIASNRAVLAFAALAMPLFEPLPLTGALPLHAGFEVYPSDILVLLAVGSWAAAWLLNPEEGPASLGTRLLGWPLLLFGIVLFTAIVRGHERYGESLVGIPLRFLLYAGIAAAVTDLRPRDAYRWLVGLFYAGTVWQALVALYGYATGTSVTSESALSTGGIRVLAGSTAMFMAGALLLALLNLAVERRAGRATLHLVMVALSIFALVSTLQRTTFALVSLLVPLFVLAFRQIGLRTAVFLPMAAPFIVLLALFVPKADPTFFPTFADRVTASPSTDTSVAWRDKAVNAVWAQVREAPVAGVGFGRTVSFEVSGVRTTISADPHNQLIYLWAGGGLLLLGSFVLLLVVYLVESARRFARGTIDERPFIFWTVSLWFVFLLNSLTGIVLTSPPLLLVFWVLMVLPMTVRLGERDAHAPS